MATDEDHLIMQGYRQGEIERIALATSNSNLRSDLLRTRQLAYRLAQILYKLNPSITIDPDDFDSLRQQWTDVLSAYKTEVKNNPLNI